jgi:hypothetical protein
MPRICGNRRHLGEGPSVHPGPLRVQLAMQTMGSAPPVADTLNRFIPGDSTFLASLTD